jgi:hypothetical protein
VPVGVQVAPVCDCVRVPQRHVVVVTVGDTGNEREHQPGVFGELEDGRYGAALPKI